MSHCVNRLILLSKIKIEQQAESYFYGDFPPVFLLQPFFRIAILGSIEKHLQPLNCGNSSVESPLIYSVLNATTGSFFAALLEGMIPAIKVRSTLITIRAIATGIGKNALSVEIPVK